MERNVVHNTRLLQKFANMCVYSFLKQGSSINKNYTLPQILSQVDKLNSAFESNLFATWYNSVKLNIDIPKRYARYYNDRKAIDSTISGQ